MAGKVSDEEKLKFIEDNATLIPLQSVDNFYKHPLDKQYTNMQTYVRKKRERETIVGQVKSYLKSTKVQPEEVKQLIEVCNKWMERNKQKLIDRVNEQIKKLEEERERYTNL